MTPPVNMTAALVGHVCDRCGDPYFTFSLPDLGELSRYRWLCPHCTPRPDHYLGGAR